MLLYCVCFVLLFRIWAIFFQVQVPEVFFALRVGGGGGGGAGVFLESLIHGGLIFGLHNK